MMLHVYDIMNPAYVPKDSAPDFQPYDFPHFAADDSDFYLKIVNQYEDDMLVYLSGPPARKDERVTGSNWSGWDGPIKTLRGEVEE
jgi:hypothetical protein